MGTFALPSGAWYASLEDFKSMLDFNETARNDREIRRALKSGTDAVDYLLNRTFLPSVGTRYFDFPNTQTSWPWRLYFYQNDLISATSVTAGGATIPPAGYFLEPANAGPPFTFIEINVGTQYAFSAGATFQRAIAITGLWGFTDEQVPSGTLAAAVTDTTGTAVTVTDSASVGIGNVIIVDSERMIVSAKTMVTTGQTGSLTASQAAVSLAVADGTVFTVGETLLIESERVRVVDIAGNTLTVKRAWDGSVLAAHTTATIFAPRRLTVQRGALGTTAATHLNGAAIAVQSVPAGVAQLCLAEAALEYSSGRFGWPGQSETGSKAWATILEGIGDMRNTVNTTYGRRARSRVI